MLFSNTSCPERVIMSEVELISDGCLGTCWYGKYHYIEPWVGCEFNCAYCYARFRSPVTEKIKALNTCFTKPVPLMDEDLLLKTLAEQIVERNVEIAKLSRYTDVFSPTMVKNGFSYKVFKTLVDSPIRRIILTTKGVPDERIKDLFIKNKHKISYNLAAKPVTAFPFEGEIPPLKERLEAAAEMSRNGVLTTVHMDPVIAGVEDKDELLRGFLRLLKKYNLNRVMFSYLLINDQILSILRDRFGEGVAAQLLTLFEERPRQVLPSEEETTYMSYKPEIKKESIDRMSRLLTEMEFDFVLCSLKSGKGKLKINTTECPLCDGEFYA